MSRSSARRGQAEPLAALVAATVVAAALGAYVGVLPGVLPDETERNLAAPAATQVSETLRVGGVADPARLDGLGASTAAGRHRNVSLRVGERRWTVGPQPPDSADVASRVLPVRTGDRVVPGRLRVEVWP